MEAAKDARQLALDHASLPPATREVSVSRGYGKKRHIEKVLTTGHESSYHRIFEMAARSTEIGGPRQTKHLADVPAKTQGSQSE